MIRDIRVKKEMSLRDLALNSDIDVAYLSRVERETINPPQSEELIDAISLALELSGELAQKLKDQAFLDNEKYPPDIAQNLQQVEGFPLFLRTVSNKKIDAEKLKELTDFINERY